VSADSQPVTFEVVHTTEYAYSDKVSVSHHLARLSPRGLPHQTCLQHVLEFDPEPAVQASHTDYFGNPTTFFAMQGAHTQLTVRARSTVRVETRPLPDFAETLAWDAIASDASLPLDALEAISGPFRIRPEFRAYAATSFPRGRPILEAVAELTQRIYEDFTFDPKATTVTTSLADVFRLRRGVCQDFARFEIACLRSLELPARYISGYLETSPPPGKPRRVGADASHAWLAVYCKDGGWIDVDPTNNLLPANGHVTLAWGRDYNDVSPIRGVILGGGEHTLRVNVDVVRAPEAPRSDR
jgi:transglutaminase-like putative cysteine protease